MSCILYYIIGQIILAFWLVLTYDLLEDRRIDDVIRTNILLLFLRWLKTIFPYETWALTRSSARGVTRSPEGSRDSARDGKLTRNMGARGLLHKTLFPLSLVSSLRYRIFLSSETSILQAISNQKTFFWTAVLERKRKLWCWCCDRSRRLSI